MLERRSPRDHRPRLAAAALATAGGNLAGAWLVGTGAPLAGGLTVGITLLLAGLALWPITGLPGLIQALALAVGILGLAVLLGQDGEILRRLLPVLGTLAGGLVVIRGVPIPRTRP